VTSRRFDFVSFRGLASCKLHGKDTGCFTTIGFYKKLATLNPENILVNVISIDI
jgi:hypothetical protein